MEGFQRFVSVTNMTVIYLTKKESIGVSIPPIFWAGHYEIQLTLYPT